jgi:hypothetical protein
VRVQGLYHEPLIWMSSTHLGPTHAPMVPAGADR